MRTSQLTAPPFGTGTDTGCLRDLIDVLIIIKFRTPIECFYFGHFPGCLRKFCCPCPARGYRTVALSESTLVSAIFRMRLALLCSMCCMRYSLRACTVNKKGKKEKKKQAVSQSSIIDHRYQYQLRKMTTYRDGKLWLCLVRRLWPLTLFKFFPSFVLSLSPSKNE